MTWPYTPCPCGRTASGFGYQQPSVRNAPFIRACSPAHLHIIAQHKGNVVALTDTENQAVMAASPAIGQYLEGTGVTDMAAMSYEQWMDFLAFAFEAVLDERARLWETQSGGVPV